MTTIRNPPGLPIPRTYHLGVEVSGPVRTLYVAGQIGRWPDGTIPADFDGQARAVYANRSAVLAGAGMGLADVVRSTAYLVRPADPSAFAAVRAEATGEARHASTLVYVAGLALPELLVEVQAVAVTAADGPV